MLIRRTFEISPRPRPPLTPERIAEIEANAPRDEDIVFDEDCPEMTDEQLAQFRRVNPLPRNAASRQKLG